MRTTLDIEDNVLQAAKELAQREGGPAGQVLSALARRGLALPTAGRKSRSATRGGEPVLPSRGEEVTLEHAQRLRDKEGV
ncbi:MAG: hypothetical protein ABIR24_13355 [Verrucomicrobiota bacterium]